MIKINRNGNEKHCEVILRKVLHKTANKRHFGLDGELKIIDYDLDRLYFENEHGVEYFIRTWNITKAYQGHNVIYTLFFDTREGDSNIDKVEDSLKGKLHELSEGYVAIKYKECE